MTPHFEWDPAGDGVEPPPADPLAFWSDEPGIDRAPVWQDVQAGMRADGQARRPIRVRPRQVGMADEVAVRLVFDDRWLAAGDESGTLPLAEGE